MPLPDIKGREAILKHYIEKVVSGEDVDINVLARGTPGFSGAELSNLVNMAAIRAAVTKQVAQQSWLRIRAACALSPSLGSAGATGCGDPRGA